MWGVGEVRDGPQSPRETLFLLRRRKLLSSANGRILRPFPRRVQPLTEALRYGLRCGRGTSSEDTSVYVGEGAQPRMARLALLVARALLALPDLHRVRPWWRGLRAARVQALRLTGVVLGDRVTVHEWVHFDRRVMVSLRDRSEVRDRVRVGIAEVGERSGSFTLGAGSVVLSDSQIDCTAPVTVGSGTHVGRRAQVFTHAHNVSQLAVSVLEAPVTSAPVVIGDDVMIYNDVVILPGVKIGDGAVVAIRAVVTRDVPAGAIVAGVPARVVGHRT